MSDAGGVFVSMYACFFLCWRRLKLATSSSYALDCAPSLSFVLCIHADVQHALDVLDSILRHASDLTTEDEQVLPIQVVADIMHSPLFWAMTKSRNGDSNDVRVRFFFSATPLPPSLNAKNMHENILQ